MTETERVADLCERLDGPAGRVQELLAERHTASAEIKRLAARCDELEAKNANLAELNSDLVHALKSMLTGTDEDAQEHFPGHTRAYLKTVAIPRAEAVLAKVDAAS